MAWQGTWRAACVVMCLAGCAKQAPPPASEAASSDGMAMYAGQLYGCLQQAFAPPANATPGLSAHLQFKVMETGAVAEERIAQSSGNADFDSALLAAVARCRQVPAPPPDVLALLREQGLTLLFER